MGRRITSQAFIGRETALVDLERLRADALAGRPGRALISGEAGVGKTRLLDETARRARADGWLVLGGGCIEMGEGGLPFGPWVEILRAWVRAEGRAAAAIAGPAGADLARLVPELGSDRAAPEQRQWVQTRIHDALLDVLLRIAARQPLLLTIEDLHWADQATLAATAFVLHGLDSAPAGAPIMLVSTYRPEDLHRRHPLRAWLAATARQGDVARIELPPFDLAEMGRLMQGVLGSEASRTDVERLLARSDGNPFFAEELLISGPETGRSDLSPSLRDLLSARIASVSEPARTVLGVVAVAGRSVEHDLLATVLGDASDDLASALREAVDAGLLLATSGPAEDRYAFRHALVQEAAYAELLPAERRDLHRRYARCMEDDRGAGTDLSRAVELAWHWRSTRDASKAFSASVAAGDAALAAFAFEQADTEYQHALAAWEQVADPERLAGIDRIELLRRTSTAAHLVAHDREAVALLREAVDLALEGGDRVRAGVLLVELGRSLWTGGDTDGSVSAHERALTTLPVDPSAERARALSGLGQVLMLTGHYERSLTLCEGAIAMARAVGSRSAEAHALNTAGTDLAATGDTERAVALLRASLEIAQELRDADDISRAYVNLADVHWWSGDIASAQQVAHAGIDAAESLGVTSSYGFYLRVEAALYDFMGGDTPAALRWLGEAAARGPGGDGDEHYRLCYTLQVLVATGAPDAEAAFQRARELSLRSGREGTHAPPVQTGGAELALWQHRATDAVAIALDGLRRLARTEAHRFTLELAQLAARAVADAVEDGSVGRDEAAAILEEADRTATAAEERMGGRGSGLRAVIDAERARLDAELARARGADRFHLWQVARDRWSALGVPYHVAYLEGRLALAADAAGQRAVAIDALRQAQATAADLRAVPLVTWLAEIARRLRIAPATVGRPAEAEPDRAFALTARESEVLGLVAQGWTNRRIGAELFISESTVGVHVSNILGKLEVATRTEAVAVARRAGLLET